MSPAPVLVTGFEPFGSHSRNPAFEAMQVLDGRTVAGVQVVGRALPVSMARLRPALADILDSGEFAAIISLGLHPHAAAIHIERGAVNVADFDIADNDGLSLKDAEVTAGGPAARLSTLPLRAIEHGLLTAGIPAQLSASAGTYLCNACLYLCLEAVAAHGRPPLCGFLHLPSTPELVAEAALKQGQARHVAASMELSRIVAGVEIAVRETVGALAQARLTSADQRADQGQA
jgi:pyroglutamyl-peptidase